MKKLYKFTISETVTKKVEEKSKDKDCEKRKQGKTSLWQSL